MDIFTKQLICEDFLIPYLGFEYSCFLEMMIIKITTKIRVINDSNNDNNNNSKNNNNENPLKSLNYENILYIKVISHWKML